MKPNKKTPEEMVVYLKRQITDMEEDAYKLKAENARLKEALHSIHNYIANPEHHDMLRHILDIDKMVLSALYEEEEGE